VKARKKTNYHGVPNSTPVVTAKTSWLLLGRKKLYRKEDLLSPEPDEDFISTQAEYDAPRGKYEALRSKIEGSPELRRKIRDKCLAYADIFSCGLTPDPARSSTHAVRSRRC
jgi:hypothetical protein